MTGLCLLVWAAQAQEGFQYGLLQFGWQQPQAWSVSAGFDVVTRYHNSVELALSFEHPQKANDELLLGLVYKPVLIRGKNSAIKLRLGVLAGSDQHSFVGGPQGGWEWQYSLGAHLDFLVLNQYSYCWGSERSWRVGVALGLRMTL